MSTLQENTVVLDLIFCSPSNKAACEEGEVQTEADAEWVKASKLLLKNTHLDATVSIANRAKEQVRQWALKRPKWLKRGAHLITLPMIERVNEYLRQEEAAYMREVDLFLTEYEQAKEEAKRRLKGLYNPDDYPEAWRLRAKFGVLMSFVEYGVPGAAKVGEKLQLEALAQMKKSWIQAEQEARVALRAEIKGLLSHLAQRLKAKDENSRSRLCDSAMDSVLDWFRTIKQRNIFADGEFDSLVADTKKILAGRAGVIEEYKDDSALRKETQEKISEIKARLDESIETVKRKIKFD